MSGDRTLNPVSSLSHKMQQDSVTSANEQNRSTNVPAQHVRGTHVGPAADYENC